MKKLLLVVSMMALMLSLSGCGKEAEKGFDYNEAELTLLTMQYFMEYASVDEDYYDYFTESGTDFEKSAIKGIDQAKNNDKVGEFENYNKYLYNSTSFNPESVDAEFSEGEGTVTVTILNEAKDRDVEVSVQYTENSEYFIQYAELRNDTNFINQLESQIINSMGCDMQTYALYCNFATVDDFLDAYVEGYLYDMGIQEYNAEEMVVSPVYSKAELLKQAGMNTAIGMGTVFVVLIFISFIISLFKFLPALTAKKAKMPVAKETAPVVKSSAAPVAKVEENLVNDAELVAVITAAIYAATGSGSGATSKDTLIVRSIKRAKR